MANKVLCPACRTRNPVPAGAAGIHSAACGTYIQLAESEPDWVAESFLERLVARFSSPRAMIIGTICLLLFFVAFWGVLQYSFIASKKPPIPPPVVVADDQPARPEITITPPPVAPPAVVPTSAPAVPATVPTTQLGPIPHPLPPPVVIAGDKQIGDAIRKGVGYLMSQYDPATHRVKGDANFAPGNDALCMYALLQCREAITDPDLDPSSAFMGPALEALKSASMNTTFETYSRSLRANALALIDRPSDRGVLDGDVTWLIAANRDGAYGYRAPAAGSVAWDNSNTQYGELGVWAGTEASIKVPSSYWQAVQNHWIGCQNPDGTFGYGQAGGGTLAMTVAGISSLFIAHDFLAQSSPAGVDSRSPALIKGLNWMSRGDNAISIFSPASHYQAYALYGVARAGLASNYKYFGTHDWYTELATVVLKAQREDGCFTDTIDTALTLLFLARGRHPIMFNKLSIDGVVMDHPRDTANLARYATHEIEHRFNAQIVPLAVKWNQWMESPVLYMASASVPEISDDEVQELRAFVLAGGLLVTNANSGSAKFSAFAENLALRMLPEYAYQQLPPDSPVYSALFNLNPPPVLKGVSNGVRLLMVHSPVDLAKSWDVHDWTHVELAYKVGLNLFLYAAGKRDFRNRLDTLYVPAPEPATAPEVTLNIARLRYAGGWDPEPYAWTRLARMFQWQTSFAARVEPTDIAKLNPRRAQIAVLTGIDARQFSPDEIKVMSRFVQAGGILLVDSCGGAQGFASSQSALLSALAPGASLTPITGTHPLTNGAGVCMDSLPKPLPRIPGPAPDAPGILSLGRGHIIMTPLDLTEGLLGDQTLGIRGYHPDYASRFVKNVLLWSFNGQPEGNSE